MRNHTLNVYRYLFHILFEETIFILKNVLPKFKCVTFALEMSRCMVYVIDRTQYISGIVTLTEPETLQTQHSLWSLKYS